MIRLFLIAAAAVLVIAAAPAGSAASGILDEANQAAQINFGETIVFSLETPWEGPPPARATVLFGLPGSLSRNFAHAQPALSGGRLTAQYAWEIRDALAPGVELEFYWRIRAVDGSSHSTSPARIVYEDSSLPWSRIGDGQVEIVWYEGGDQFGRRMLQIAQKALLSLKDAFGVTLERSTRIVLYADVDKMRQALGGGASPWVAGQAIAPLNVVILHAPPGSSELDVLIAHELTHIVVDQMTKNPFSGPPAWIHEGLATYNESTVSPRFDYERIVAKAVRENALISLRGLTATFPANSSGAILAYAESNSLMRFVIDRFGATAVRRLLETYKQGVTDDEAVRLALGVGLSELEAIWLAHIGAGPMPAAEAKPSPQPVLTAPAAAPGPAVTPSPPAQSPSPVLNAVTITPSASTETARLLPTTSPALQPASPVATPVATAGGPSQIRPATASIRSVVVGTVGVIAVLLALISWQYVRSRRQAR